MKRTFLSLVMAALAALPTAAADRTLVEGIVVRVNDRILTTRDMQRRVLEREGESGKPVTPADVPALVQEAADELCILERASELKMEVAPEEVTSMVAQLREQNHVADDAAFENSLASMGLTLEALRTRLRETILVNRLLAREAGTAPITDEELRQRFVRDKALFMVPERVHLEHIVFPLGRDEASLEARMAEAKRLVAAARGGAPFKTLVDETVAGGQATGGDLGVVGIPDLRAEVRDAVANLKPGEISEPFVSPAGLHVLRLVERITPTLKPFEDVVDELRQRETFERNRSHLSSVVEGLKKRYVVETHPELFVLTPAP